jgi:hypothetical protein
MEVSGQLHAPAVLPRKKVPPVLILQETGWAPELKIIIIIIIVFIIIIKL